MCPYPCNLYVIDHITNREEKQTKELLTASQQYTSHSTNNIFVYQTHSHWYSVLTPNPHNFGLFWLFYIYNKCIVLPFFPPKTLSHLFIANTWPKICQIWYIELTWIAPTLKCCFPRSSEMLVCISLAKKKKKKKKPPLMAEVLPVRGIVHIWSRRKKNSQEKTDKRFNIVGINLADICTLHKGKLI